MQFKYLPPPLEPCAIAAARHFRTHYGFTKVRCEESISANVEWRPTLSATTRDHHVLCLEVSESAYPPHLDEVILAIRNRALPVRLYVVVPAGMSGSEFERQFQRAKENGVGVVTVGTEVRVLAEAVSLSLNGLRRVQPRDFPNQYRTPLSTAQSTFLGGNPPQGCQTVYQEIEGLTRRIAKKVDEKGLWKNGKRPTKIKNLARSPWRMVAQALRDEVDFKRAGCPLLNRDGLLDRVCGITAHRNETGHKPESRSQLIRRDQQHRTRFETAVDLLKDLVDASKPLRPG